MKSQVIISSVLSINYEVRQVSSSKSKHEYSSDKVNQSKIQNASMGLKTIPEKLKRIHINEKI